MNCPHCGTELPNGTRYCTTCGTDVEAASAPRHAAPTQQMPAAPSQGAVSMHPGQAQPGRTIDTKSMSPAPKWPYVLLAVLAVLVVVAVLLIVLHPWSSSTSDPAVGADDAAVTAQPAADAQVGEQGTDVAEPSGDGAQQAAASPVFASLSELYGRLSGYDASISSVATDFNNNYLSADQSLRQSYADQAASLLSSISADYEAVKALAVAEDSPYYNTWQNNVTLYDCLYNRARVLSEAWDLSAQAADPSSVQDDISRVLGADNDSSGVNTYKTKYNTLYPASEPQQQ